MNKRGPRTSIVRATIKLENKIWTERISGHAIRQGGRRRQGQINSLRCLRLLFSSSPQTPQLLFSLRTSLTKNLPQLPIMPVAVTHDTIPAHAKVLVIGGGPGGSYSACALAREGIDVVLLEGSSFPRYHIGESMLPSVRPFLRFIKCEEKVVKHGFQNKPGAAVKFNQFKREGYTDFIALDPDNGAWNVIRSEFDNIIFEHAAECGAQVFQQTKVTSIDFGPDTPPPSPPATLSGPRPVRAHYERTYSGGAKVKGSIDFDYLIDASGRNGIMSTKYLHNRKMNETLKNVACWGYWTGGAMYMPGTTRENAPYFEALTDETGWAWYIPLHDGTVSVGIVMNQNSSNAKKAASKEAAQPADFTLLDHYHEQLEFAPHVLELLKNATLVQNDGPAVKAASDYSYAATSYSGDHFRLVGDAAAFIDPFFSSGVHLAFTGGLSAAASVASSIRDISISEQDASDYHDKKVGVSYTRFLLVVMGAYKQIRNQAENVLTDVDEDNFDRAFSIIRPVIQGTADAGKRLSENELQKTMDFCKHVFAPTDPEMHEAVGARVDPSLFSPDGPVMTPDDLEKVLAPGDDEARHVLHEVNARKPVHIMYNATGNFDLEDVNGYKVNVVPGSLGLRKA
ncbi:FAD/NAD(P)-binding domain-containing protein [Sistotremastrum niveocremeum HHB9708]|uniref:FAD/NAD(P)-binding domain-containing protein n=2 Tax=Sistotremastraceae TaxID=3402574 RepID=A0A164Y6Y2_9AGAM|nr:FAD/NAD(P)-binding domain-containing protein [Sistotremastrum niveocremeum HHB9708]KZT42329.1 FAD/NAD(P)-binding domain-containing protein [Sistotremastrum suecicum HHB10207 ss-3]